MLKRLAMQAKEDTVDSEKKISQLDYTLLTKGVSGYKSSNVSKSQLRNMRNALLRAGKMDEAGAIHTAQLRLKDARDLRAAKKPLEAFRAETAAYRRIEGSLSTLKTSWTTDMGELCLHTKKAGAGEGRYSFGDRMKLRSRATEAEVSLARQAHTASVSFSGRFPSSKKQRGLTLPKVEGPDNIYGKALVKPWSMKELPAINRRGPLVARCIPPAIAK